MKHLFFCLGLLIASPVLAQDASLPAVLVADEILVTPDRDLIATGNVEVFQGDTRLQAKSITYDPDSDTLVIEGPLTIRDADGTITLASEAELNQNLRSGILKSARLVLENQLQLAAVQLNRVDARYSQLYKAAVTSCRVCHSDKPPLWQIRAKRVIHDRQEQQLYFENAQLRVGNVPILYIPRLRLPDPTLERATGFLIPSLANNTQLGFGVKIPYFIRLGDHRDLTLTPYLSSETTTLEFRYRQAFRRGSITFNGAVSDDTLVPDETRYYVFGSGTFALKNDFRLDFDIEAASDNSYLSQYSFSLKDRLDSEIAISRVRRDQYIRGGVIVYDSLRTNEIESQLPTIVTDANYERRYFPAKLGGEVRLSLEAHNHIRSSQSTVSGEGRDVTRLHADVFWLNRWVFGGGIVADTQIGTAFEFFQTDQDVVFEGSETRAIPQAAFALSYPVSKVSASGTTHFLEPKIQLAWTGDDQANVASDESGRVEFDEGNLFALSRFPAPDRREHEAVLALGGTWARFDPNGSESHMSFGQIIRETALDDFTDTSGLTGTESDFLVAGQYRAQSGLALAGRGLFDDGFNFSKAEIRGDWSNGSTTIGGSYVWLTEDPDEERDSAVSELTLSATQLLKRNWTATGNWRYDLEDDRSSFAGLGVTYDNECVSANFNVLRRFASSSVVEPTTDFSFTISLRGFSAQAGNERFTKTCSSHASSSPKS